jgi:hypothetical protein
MADFPYLLSPKSVRPFFNHIQGAGVPAKVTQKYLEATGFKNKSDRSLIGVLKFLKFIDDGGSPTELWKKFRSKTAGGTILAAALKKAYKGLFETYPDACDRPNERIQDFISGHSNAGGRVLSGMVGTFKALCAVADFSGATEREEPERDEDDPDEEEKDKGETRQRLKTNAKTGVQVTLNVQLVVPATDDPAIYDSFFDAMKRHLLQSDE